MTMFSVILPTRNRPALFRAALESVLTQTCESVEVIVVLDGPSEDVRPAYRAIEQETAGRTRFFWITHWLRGHGHAYALNYGAAQARGEYLCFLDDDDNWTDRTYLEHVRSVFDAAEATVDAHLATQAAFFKGAPRPGPIWTEDMEEILRKLGRQADARGAFTVTIDELLQSIGFCHLNTLIVRRALFEKIGGADQDNRYDPDRDLYFRVVDNAETIKFTPKIVSRHNIPDPDAAASVSTSLSALRKRLYQMQLLNKAVIFGRHESMRAYARLHSGYTLKKIAQDLAHAGRYSDASVFARQALGVGPTAKWAAYCAWLGAKSMLSRRTGDVPSRS